MKSTTPKPTTEWLPVAQLDVDMSVNTRPLKRAKVAQIADNFDPDKFRYIEVSARPNGRFVILDGQHRVEAVRKLGWVNGQMVECKIHRGCSHERECELFDGLNDQQLMAPIPRMLARIGAGMQPDVGIAEVVSSLGLTIAPWTGDGNIASAKALFWVYGGARERKQRDENATLLRATLRLIMAAWGKQKDALRGDVIEGVGTFLARYGNTVDRAALVTKLAQTPGGPLGIVADARVLKGLHNMNMPQAVAAKLVLLYNERRRSNKLPDWWSTQ